MPARIVIANPQNLVRDCYAPCPAIDLTLRSNGEEKVQVMDALGNFYPAGLGDGPTVAPTIGLSGAATFPAAKYWCYRYVWVAKVAFPKAQAITTGGGSSAPKTNPSPSVTTNGSNTSGRVVTVGTSSDPIFSHIWIYRSGYFDTAEEAETNSDAGVLFWIGEVENDISNPTTTFTDDASEIGSEQIENDNFPCPQFSLCVYAEPYFYGIGNNDFVGNVTIDTAGLITLSPSNTPSEQWFDGRNAQVATFLGIASGGFDGLGNFYFKYVSGTTANLYSDIALTVLADPGFIGTTQVTIHGNSSTLYRSKPRNPLAWGFTDLIDDLQIPQLYAYTVGSGHAVAIAVLPSASLLKIDLVGPSQCVTFNLRNAGTISFETSKRIVSNTYVAGSQASQFLATIDRGQNALWAFDPKSFSIVQCDGNAQVPISDRVFDSLRACNADPGSLLYAHGAYHPRLELNLLFLNDARSDLTAITHCLYHHAPTDQWGIIDSINLTASGQVLHPITGEMILMVGTYEGFFGEFAAKDKFTHWLGTEATKFISGAINVTAADTFDTAVNYTGVTGFINNWVSFVRLRTELPAVKVYARISAVVDANTLQIDKILDEDFATLASLPLWTPADEIVMNPGLIEFRVGKFFNANNPSLSKKIEELWSTWARGSTADADTPPKLQLGASYIFYGPEKDMLLAENSAPPDSKQVTFRLKENWAIYESRIIGFQFIDRSCASIQLFNYEFHLTADGSSS